MRTINYNTKKKSCTAIYSDCSFKFYKDLLSGKNHVIISSINIAKLYPEIFTNEKHILIDDNESNKKLGTVEEIISQLLKIGADRSWYLVGIGGGIVCDITGFVANIYMRGIKFGLIPTTLLSQTDAAIGGKNGVNLNEHKNIIGSFNNPEFIIADSESLKTLPEIQYKSGLGEIIKYALIGNNKILELLENHSEEIINKENDIVNKLISESAKTKIEIIENDPEDLGYRHILNFGHTIAHCIEISENLPHGIAVAKGINAATNISVKRKLLTAEKANRIKGLLEKYGFDISYELTDKQISILANDKKRENSFIKFVLLEDIGKPVIQKIPIEEISALLK